MDDEVHYFVADKGDVGKGCIFCKRDMLVEWLVIFAE